MTFTLLTVPFGGTICQEAHCIGAAPSTSVSARQSVAGITVLEASSLKHSKPQAPSNALHLWKDRVNAKIDPHNHSSS